MGSQQARVGKLEVSRKHLMSTKVLLSLKSVSFSQKPSRTPQPRESENPQVRQKQKVKIPKFSRIFKTKRYTPKVNLEFPKVNVKCFFA